MLNTDNNQTTMLTARLNKNQKGFTLIELLVVIGILAILLAIVLIAINPGRQFAQANNTKRQSDVGAILNAIGSYAADNKGQLPGGIPVAPAAAVDAGKNTLCNAIAPTYISLLPTDPQSTAGGAGIQCGAAGADVTTGYTVQADSNGRVTVSAPSTETSYGATEITVTR